MEQQLLINGMEQQLQSLKQQLLEQQMEQQLEAITPIDGRYLDKTKELRKYFSEYALIKYRIEIELKYFQFLTKNLPELKDIDKDEVNELFIKFKKFDINDVIEIKRIEKITNHDVKAVEYYIQKKYMIGNLSKYKGFIHFGLTSNDINSVAISLQIKNFINNVYIKNLEEIMNKIYEFSYANKDLPMLAHTHGQPAVPTILGKEFFVFYSRLKKQLKELKNFKHSTKFGGAIGNLNAHYVAYPEINWIELMNGFIREEFGLKRIQLTTQIDHYDNYSKLFSIIVRINTIFSDMVKDIWIYISMNYLKLKIIKDEVGSSTMPQKVNPIDFENAEGNLKIAIALLVLLITNLPISRLQRDLTDSTTLRNLGTIFGHCLIALNSISRGLSKIEPNKKKLKDDLNNNYMIVAEGIQTVLRLYGFSNSYELLKNLTRTGEQITKDKMEKFIDNLDIPDDLKTRLKGITPYNYIGKFKIPKPLNSMRQLPLHPH
jgi:adenylosuccinate lyase